jgi:tetratricopeptide (TPR) repeat protein
MASPEEIESMLRSGTSARRAGHFAEALQRLNEATALCGPDQPIHRAHVLREPGELARNTHDLNAAQAHYKAAIALLRASDDQLKLAHTIRHLGDVHAQRQQWTEAEECFAEALAVYRNHPATGALDLANAIRSHALLNTRTGQRDAARALWREAGKLYESEGIAAGVEECRRQAEQLA